MDSFRGCVLAFLACVLVSLSSAPWAHAQKKHPLEENGIKSKEGVVEATLKFVNKSKETVKVYWIDYDGQRKLYETLKDGESYEQQTFLTHPWLITDEQDNAWEIYLPEAQPKTIDIMKPVRK